MAAHLFGVNVIPLRRLPVHLYVCMYMYRLHPQQYTDRAAYRIRGWWGGGGGGGGGGDELPKVLGGQCNMGVYWCTETVLIQ